MGMAELDPNRHRERGVREWETLKRTLIDTCEKCEGTGTRYNDIEWDDEDDDELLPNRRASICSCKTTALFHMNLHEAGLPREFWEADKIDPEMNRDQFAIVDAYAEKVAFARKHGLGLVLTGKNGAGKTTCAARIAIAAVRAGYSVAYVNFPHLVDAWRRAWSDPTLATYLDERVCADFLILDELGKEHQTRDESFVSGKLDGIVRMRSGDLFPTVYVSNLMLPELVERYGASLASLLSQTTKSVKFRPGDFRKKADGRKKRLWDELLPGGSE